MDTQQWPAIRGTTSSGPDPGWHHRHSWGTSVLLKDVLVCPLILRPLMLRQRRLSLSSRRKPESRSGQLRLDSAFAGMTKRPIPFGEVAEAVCSRNTEDPQGLST